MNRVFSFGLATTLLCGAVWASSDVSSHPHCRAGDIKCVKKVVKEMNKRFKKLSKSCDHDAIFSLLYLRTTEKYGETAESLGYSDVSSVTREDAVFADYYFRAYDNYHSGSGFVPPAWQVAFDAAENRILPAQGNALVGISAHIQRDLPFTLYDLHLQGNPVSYEDHTLVNEFLALVDIGQEVVDEFDPDYPLGGSSELIFDWREQAWQNYIALRDAPTEAARATVAAQIEAFSAAVGAFFAQNTAYPPGENSDARDQYCADN